MHKTIYPAAVAAMLLSVALPAVAEDLRPVAVGGPVTLGYRFAEEVPIAESRRHPGYGIVYVDGRTYWVDLAARRVVRGPGAAVELPETVTYAGSGKTRMFTETGTLAPGLVLTPEAQVVPVPGQPYGYISVEGRVVFVDLATRTILSAAP
jgi:SH3 domain protein